MDNVSNKNKLLSAAKSASPSKTYSEEEIVENLLPALSKTYDINNEEVLSVVEGLLRSAYQAGYRRGYEEAM